MSSFAILDEYAAGFVSLRSPRVHESMTAYYSFEVQRLARLLSLIKYEFTTRLVLSPHTLPILMKHAELMLKQLMMNTYYLLPQQNNEDLSVHMKDVIELYTELHFGTKITGIANVESVLNMVATMDLEPDSRAMWENPLSIKAEDKNRWNDMRYVIDVFRALDHIVRIVPEFSLENVIRCKIHKSWHGNCRDKLLADVKDSEEQRPAGDRNFAKDPRGRYCEDIYLEMMKITHPDDFED